VLFVRILLVDDFVPWHQAARSLLQPNAALQVVGQATDGLEAVGKAIDLQPDLVLLDIGLPGMNGFEAACQILSVSPGSKIVFLTENYGRALVERARSTGAHGYVVKSDAVRQLLSVVEAVIAGAKFVGPESEN
jgi:DNA-binding NarL/FixJ family response regulator